MKKLKFLLPLLLLILTSCNKCDDQPDMCSISSSNINQGSCEAYFESWFYDKSSGKCEKVGYSGCSATGFETEEACFECICD